MSGRHRSIEPAVSYEGTDAQALPEIEEERRVLGIAVSTWPNIIAPAAIGILALGLWELTVRLKGVPAYVLPGPMLIVQALVSDWPTLSPSLTITLRTTAAALI